MLLDTIEAFKKKILAWTPETQYASLIISLSLMRYLFYVYLNQKNNYDTVGV